MAGGQNQPAEQTFPGRAESPHRPAAGAAPSAFALHRARGAPAAVHQKHVPADEIGGIGDKVHRRASVGTGLGLSSVRGSVELLGGSCGVTSTLGKGSDFWFELPTAGYGHAAAENNPALTEGDRFGERKGD